MLDWLYEHAMYATDPVQRLRLFERRLQAVSELRFHRELAAVFRGLRDMHTAYQLPAHYRGRVAALVILVEPYQDRDGTPRMRSTGWRSSSPTATSASGAGGWWVVARQSPDRLGLIDLNGIMSHRAHTSHGTGKR